jgi:EmrB/QacA subfamily drug resistance transporter
MLGLGIFTVASAAAALATSADGLIAARALQGVGGAIVTPLTLTLLAQAFPPGRRGIALGIWSGIAGVAVAIGPVIGGAVVDGISWHWIFWFNVPVGILTIALASRFLEESHGPSGRLDLGGAALATVALAGIVWGVVRGNDLGWTSTQVLGALTVGVAGAVAFVVWETRVAAPMLPLRLFRSRAFTATNLVSLAMYFGTFGSIFLLAQFLQTVQGYSAFEAGVRTLPWTLMPMFIAPIAGALSDRIGGRPLMATGLALQAIALAWLASITTVDVAYSSIILPFILAGTGMALVFAPVANVVMGVVRMEEQGLASATNNMIREVGGVLGIAVLVAIFSAAGGYGSGQAFVDGLVPAVYTGAGVLALGAIAALQVPRIRNTVAPIGR